MKKILVGALFLCVSMVQSAGKSSNDMIAGNAYISSGIEKKDYMLEGNGEKCIMTFKNESNKPILLSSTCSSIVNSKGIRILCTKNKKICKTESEVHAFVMEQIDDISNKKNQVNPNIFKLKTVDGRDITIIGTENGFIFEEFKGKLVFLQILGPLRPKFANIRSLLTIYNIKKQVENELEIVTFVPSAEYAKNKDIIKNEFFTDTNTILDNKNSTSFLSYIQSRIEFSGAPTWILFDKKGEFLITKAGFSPKQFASVLNYNKLVTKKINIIDIDYYDCVKNEELLTQAAKYRDLEATLKILQQGKDINKKNKDGKTALIIASAGTYNTYASLPLVKLLVSKGANMELTDKNGNTALMKASRRKGNLEIVKYLIENGANTDSILEAGLK